MAWNRSTEQEIVPHPQSPRNGKLVIAGVLAVLIVGAFFYLTMKDAPTEPVSKPERKFVKNKPATTYTAPVRTVKTEKQPDPPKHEMRNKILKMTPEERFDLAVERMKKREPDLTPTTNMPFRTGTELQIARIFMTQLGDAPPPFFPMPLEDEIHIDRILSANNPALEGDSEKVKIGKEIVEDVKKEMREFVKEGGDPHEFLKYYHGKLVSAFEERNTTAREIMRVAREEPDIAAEFYEAANKKLAAKGIKEFELPKKIKQRIGLED